MQAMLTRSVNLPYEQSVAAMKLAMTSVPLDCGMQ